jgi:hypothetical protein
VARQATDLAQAVQAKYMSTTVAAEIDAFSVVQQATDLAQAVQTKYMSVKSLIMYKSKMLVSASILLFFESL